jgi:hypothetical protein
VSVISIGSRQHEQSIYVPLDLGVVASGVVCEFDGFSSADSGLNYLRIEVTRILVFVDSGGGEVVGNQFVSLSQIANFVVAVFEGDWTSCAIGTSTSGGFK